MNCSSSYLIRTRKKPKKNELFDKAKSSRGRVLTQIHIWFLFVLSELLYSRKSRFYQIGLRFLLVFFSSKSNSFSSWESKIHQIFFIYNSADLTEIRIAACSWIDLTKSNLFKKSNCRWFCISYRQLELARNSSCNSIIACFWINVYFAAHKALFIRGKVAVPWAMHGARMQILCQSTNFAKSLTTFDV